MDNTLTVPEMFDIFYRHEGRDTGFEEVPVVYQDVYEHLIQLKAEFDEQMLDFLFGMVETYKEKDVYNKDLIKENIEESKSELEASFMVSIDPEKSVNETIKTIHDFLDGKDIDTNEMFILHVAGLYEKVKIEDLT